MTEIPDINGWYWVSAEGEAPAVVAVEDGHFYDPNKKKWLPCTSLDVNWNGPIPNPDKTCKQN